ncbi:ATP-dependent DNA ligase [Galbitalea sp. SE-J8]|uniref:ATP-dependent DNA ligase n=1 Tax=Galbitalea sp. SE-J8 TaxID=3054952 RepID=UPI00259C9A94|nr:ATP-dependent DNA ligase [Galbitalea sp. SE-J8]MDM4762611.1 ATP-dependent DNA ligase [Galbitalea sp. SE-J8]
MARGGKSSEQWVTVGAHRLKITNLDKVIYPETGTTKGEVLDYYARIAPVLIPHARDRPATRKRWVNGVGTDDAPGEVFFQKNLDPSSTPDFVTHRVIRHTSSANDYPLVNNRATLVWLAQIAALEIHVPQWRFGRDGEPKNPDRFVIDLDPGPGVSLTEVAEVARWARALLEGMGLAPLPVTSGSKGIHLYARLDGRQSSKQVTAVAHELARALEADHPDEVVSDMKKTLRDGKVLVDWSQNNGNKTTIAPYSLRGRSHPTVAAPRTWRELASKSLRQLGFAEVLERVEARGDVLDPLRHGDAHGDAHGDTHGDTHAAEHGAERAAEGDRDRLATYRSMRDAAKTPEPVPAGAPTPGDGNSFVIQEHHARRLHWDFRLERDGVLVSWALPKGVPTETGKNHLAVHTEDHPLEYGGFAGDIPGGEYGAGHVDIWDAGSYRLEKWREGKEVIVTLDGDRLRGVRLALIHTGRGDADAKNWLIHLMKDQPPPDARTDAAPPPARPRSTRALPKPQLATLGSTSDLARHEEDYAFEMKWDGFRAIAEVSRGAIRVMSRNDLDLTATFPELSDLLRAVTVDVVLDGEIVALDRSGRPDFGRLQQRAGLTRAADVERARREVAVQYLVFDILERDGEPLGQRPWRERRRILEQTVRSTGAVQVPPVFDGALDAAVTSSRGLGLEGLVAKRRSGAYAAGRRSRDWIKIKHNRTQEVVVAGWRPGNGSRAGRIGSLLVGVPEGDGIRYVGRVGTGFRERDLDEMLARFERMSRATSPLDGVPSADARDAHWVRPELVGEVEFAEWTSGGRLRQPRWRGWRIDKAPAEVRVKS